VEVSMKLKGLKPKTYIMSDFELLCWKKLLDGQDELVTLEI
jgi:hypothetical protein